MQWLPRLRLPATRSPYAPFTRESFFPSPSRRSRPENIKIVPLFPPDRTLTISENEMAQFAFMPEMFDNLNTPEDLERARLRSITRKP